MFTTYDGMKFPVQLGKGVTTWTAVEIETNAPWFMVALRDEQYELERRFLFLGIEEAVAFASQRSIGEIAAIRLFLPPQWSTTGDWEMLRITRVDEAIDPDCPGKPSISVISECGTRYGGFPVEPVDCANREFTAIFDLINA